jgi:hypothetical protein
VDEYCNITQDAARGGSIEVVEWLRQEQIIAIHAEVLTAAARSGQTIMCEYLLSAGCDLSSCACNEAAENGHLDTLRWLRDHNCPWYVSEVCMNAARYGHIDIFDYVIEQGEVLDAELLTETLNYAGEFSQLSVVQWLRQHGAQWPAALGSGQRYIHQWSGDTLAWARAEGCTAPIAL